MLETKRQKIIFIALIFTVAILIWQLIAFYQNNKEIPKTLPRLVDKPEKDQIVKMDPAALASKPNTTVQPRDILNTVHTPNQSEYTKLIGQYQNLQIEQKIVQTQQAIAQARLKILKTEEKLAKIKPLHALMDLSTNDDNQKPEKKYELVYTGKNAGEWVATLRSQGQLIDVSLGDTVDGLGKITSIDSQKITIDNPTNTLILSFNGNKTLEMKNKQEENNVPVAKAGSESNSPPVNLPTQNPAEMTDASKKLNEKVNNQVLSERQQYRDQYISYTPDITHDNEWLAQNSKKTDTKKSQSITQPLQANQPVLVNKQSDNYVSSDPHYREKIQSRINEMAKSLKQPTIQKSGSIKTMESTNISKMKNSQQQSYVIQIIAGQYKNDVLTFQKQHQLIHNTKIIPTELNGHPWYSLINGPYTNVANAQKAMAALPESIKFARPFIKKLPDGNS